MVGVQRPATGKLRPHAVGGNDLDARELADAVRVIQRQPKCSVRASVIPGQEELMEAELLHNFHLSLASRLWRARQAEPVRNDPKCPRYTRGQLANPGIAGIHVVPFAVRGDDHPATLGRLSRVVGF
jgi:hypothetical protein